MARQTRNTQITADIDGATTTPAPVAPAAAAPVAPIAHKETVTMTNTNLTNELAALFTAAPAASMDSEEFAALLASSGINLDALVDGGILQFVPQKHPLNATFDELESLGRALAMKENPEFEALDIDANTVAFRFPADFDSEVGSHDGKRTVVVSRQGTRFLIENVLRHPKTGALVRDRHGIMKNDSRRFAKGLTVSRAGDALVVTGRALQDASFTAYRDVLLNDGAIEKQIGKETVFVFINGEIPQDSRELIGKSQAQAELFSSIQERNKYILLAQMHWGVQPLLSTQFSEEYVVRAIARGKNGQSLAELRRYQTATRQAARAEKEFTQAQKPQEQGRSRREAAYDGKYHNRRGGRGGRRW